MVKTKIITTVGPSSSTYSVLRKMVMSGMDVARMNFSHGRHEGHLSAMNKIRKINQTYRRHIRILQDLEGFRIRVGLLRAGKIRVINKREMVYFVSGKEEQGGKDIPIDYSGDLRRITPGKIIYIDDGNLIFKVKSTGKKRIKAEAVVAGTLKERKGINIPGVDFPIIGMTEKDKKDLRFGIKHKVDFVAQSFVRNKKDLTEVKEKIKGREPGIRLIAKIETREAIKNIDDIIGIVDGIMIARGDMGIAIPLEEVPFVQKDIIKKCNKRRKFVITATQMLESMTEHKRPTRAEVTDVANAILDGTDYVMLSGETAAGAYPVESVEMMNNVIKATEKHIKKKG